jgi:hypothetical protein
VLFINWFKIMILVRAESPMDSRTPKLLAPLQ